MALRNLSNLRIVMKPGPAHLYAALSVLAATTFVDGTLSAQTVQTKQAGIPQDWTHRHMVFSNPGTYEEAVQKGTVDKWTKITNSTRYKIQQSVRSGVSATALSAAPEAAASASDKKGIKKDWSTTLNGVAASLTGTIATLSSSNVSGSSVLTVDGVAFDADPPAGATATGTFSGSVTSTQTATITNGSNALVMTVVGGTQGTGTITVSGRPSSSDTLTVGSQGYTFASTCNSTAFCINRPNGSVSNTQYAENIAAAIMASSGLCGTASPCYGTGTTKNPNVSASASTSGSNGLVTITNTSGTSQPFTVSSSSMTQSPSPGPILAYAGSNACTSSTAGTFVLDSNTTNLATNLAAAISACKTSFSAVGVTATSSGAVVTVTAATAGTGGNSIALAKTLSNFAWSPTSALAGGDDGVTSGTSSPPTFAYWSVNNYASPLQLATNIAAAVNANTTLQSLSTGVSAAASGTTQVVFTARATGSVSYAVSEAGFSAFTGTGNLSGGGNGTALARVQPNAYPAKYSSSGTTGASCSDYIVYPTGVEGATGAATIIAYNNLYSGCTGAVPSVAWSYNTGSGEAVTTSPILSLDGTQVAFMQSNGTTAQLVLLKPGAGGTITAPGTPTSETAGTYHGCTAPCYTTISLNGSTNDTLSSPFYYYDGDVLYVGDDAGKLHQFTGVFNGTPAENTTSPWPEVLGTNKLASPVFDPTWIGGQVFVGDLGGVLHSVATATGTPSQTTVPVGGNPCAGCQIADAPLIDSSANYMLVFVNSTTANTIYGYGEQFFPTSPGIVGVGTGATNNYLYAGTYDNSYFESTNHDGYMYVVGNTGVTTGAALYRVGLSSGFLNGTGTAVVSSLTPSATNAYPWPSPVSEFCNNSASACALQTYSTCNVTNGSTTVTCTGATFTAAEVGTWIEGTDIPAYTTIAGRTGNTQITISQAATGTISNNTGTVTVGVTTSDADYVFFSLNRAQVGSCIDTVGNGCILSYNVSNPFAVAITGNGLKVITPGTSTANGCWATGGLVIDNSATTPAGGSQIYFVNLNGADAGNPSALTSSGCTTQSSAEIINGVQTTQSAP